VVAAGGEERALELLRGHHPAAKTIGHATEGTGRAVRRS
jgi:hypothetical protein